MKSCSVSKMTLPQMVGSSVVLLALAASFSTNARADDRFAGMLGIATHKPDAPQRTPEGRRPEQRFEQPRADGPREARGEHRNERHEERRDERREYRHADRQYERRMDRYERRVYRPPVWRGDIRYFDRDDGYRWRGGAWRHARHEGRLGWWWVVGGLWYFYPQPVYPYPDPYIPPVVIRQYESVETTPEIVVAPATAIPSWYYCESSRGYYPYTASCPEGWKTVPATPPDTPAQ